MVTSAVPGYYSYYGYYRIRFVKCINRYSCNYLIKHRNIYTDSQSSIVNQNIKITQETTKTGQG